MSTRELGKRRVAMATRDCWRLRRSGSRGAVAILAGHGGTAIAKADGYPTTTASTTGTSSTSTSTRQHAHGVQHERQYWHHSGCNLRRVVTAMPLLETLPLTPATAQWPVWSTTARIVLTDAAYLAAARAARRRSGSRWSTRPAAAFVPTRS